VTLPAAGVAPIVALTTDFGTRDLFVGLMKVQVHARCPAARVVDLTHELPAFDPAAGAFWLERAARWCPAGTVHVAVVDPGVGSARRLLAAVAGGQVFLGPDNGLLGAVLESPGRAHVIDLGRLERLGLGVPSATFHGRDVLAPLAAELAAGRVEVEALGPAIDDWVRSPVPRPTRERRGWRGAVVLLDRYGNAFTNLGPKQIGAASNPVIVVKSLRLPLRRTYRDVPAGSPLALVNSFDAIEIAVAQGDAGAQLELRPGTPVWLEAG